MLQGQVTKLKSSKTLVINPDLALTKLTSGQRIYVDPNDVGVAPSLMFTHRWEPAITKCWQRLVRYDSHVIDIGANFGYYTLIAGNLVNDKGSVHAFEANGHFNSYVKKSIQANWLKNKVTYNNMAVSDQPGEIELKIDESNTALSSSSAKNTEGEFTRTRQTKAISIDKYVEQQSLRRVDLIKMDIEGYEDVAYKGMHQTIKHNSGLQMLLEFAPGCYEDPRGFAEQMMKDFKFMYIIDRESKTLKPIRKYAQIKPYMKNAFVMFLLSNHLVNKKLPS